MNTNFKSNLPDIKILIARIFISTIFILVGIFYTTHFSGTKILFLSIKGLPYPTLLLTLAIINLLVGGLSVLLGFKIKWGGISLIIFLVVVTVLYHLDITKLQNGIDFMKNLSMIGGIIYMIQYSPGKYSIDSFLKNRRKMTGN